MILPDKKKTSGFTLIELMVVMTVISILVGMVLYGLNRSQAAARDTSRQQIMNGLQTALERYYGDNQSYPTGSFCVMVGTLTTGSQAYLTSGPEDPTKVSVCGGDTPGSVGGATYSYNSDGQTYTLTLIKESGGIPNEFKSPQ